MCLLISLAVKRSENIVGVGFLEMQRDNNNTVWIFLPPYNRAFELLECSIQIPFPRHQEPLKSGTIGCEGTFIDFGLQLSIGSDHFHKSKHIRTHWLAHTAFGMYQDKFLCLSAVNLTFFCFYLYYFTFS